MTNKDIANLSTEEKRALAAELLARKRARRTYPLSLAQRRLWFLDQLDPGSPIYITPYVVRLKGRLDIDAFERALNEVVRRHETLRSYFTAEGEEPRQVVLPSVVIKAERIDLSTLPEVRREEEMLRLATDETLRPFDLTAGPLIRAVFFELATDDHLLVLSMHHIITDGWSIGVLFRELSAYYRNLTGGEPIALPDLPIQYGDYALWQRDWLGGDLLQSQLHYWKEQLAGLPPLVELPIDRPRPSVGTYHGSWSTHTVPASLARRLRELSQTEGATLFMTLLAAFQALLYRYTGQEGIAVASLFGNRNRAEIEGLIGFFINTLVLRGDLSGDPTFRELLDRVRETVLGAHANQDFPFERLVEELQPERNLTHNPLVQVSFALQNFGTVALDFPGVTAEPLTLKRGISKFDLSLFVREEEDGLQTVWKYNTDLFDAETIDRFAAHYTHLLGAVVEDPDRTISTLPLLPEAELKSLAEWSGTQDRYAMRETLHREFESQVERTPDAVALVYEGERLSYRQLDRRANRLAHYLIGRGIGPDQPVGLCLDRSADLVVALLAIMKSGGAYLPIDPAYPPDRIEYMLDDAGASAVVTRENLAELFGDHAGVVAIDREEQEIARQPESNPASGAGSTNLCYVIYTSGSTGRAKGVGVEHRQLLNYVHAVGQRLELGDGWSYAMVSTIAADLGNTMLFPALLSGGSLHLISQERASDPEALGEYFQREGIDCLKIVPSHLAALLSGTDPERLMPRKRLVLGGEASRLEWVERLLDLAHGTVVYNHYGPTETTVGVLTYRVDEWPIETRSMTLPLGRPIANAKIYLVDRNMQQVPSGVPGEILIGGAPVARGYLNHPEQTEEKFIRNPFSDDPSDRLYRTGDLARYLPDGNLEFLGRIDQQVKIRGFRIEPGEIEVAVAGHPGVRESTVKVWEDKEGTKRLVAYLVPAGESVSLNDLRRHLRGKLPDYMVPSAFVTLGALPLTPNGKIDREALPLPDPSALESHTENVAPRSYIESTLGEIWSTVLRLESVGVHDNFFELGGDSILSIQIVTRAHQAGLQLTPKQLFQYQTIADLAEVVGSAPAIHASQDDVTGPVLLTPIQMRFFEFDLPEPHHWNMPMMLEADTPIDPAHLREAVAMLVRHHDALRLRFRRSDDGWEAWNAATEENEFFHHIDLAGMGEEEQRRTIEEKGASLQESLKLESGPLLRVVLFSSWDGAGARLLFIVHHLAVDGVSWRILLEDLECAYGSLVTGGKISFPPKSTSFQEWSRRLTDHTMSGGLDDELDYWLEGTAGRIGSVPRDRADGVNSEASKRTLWGELSADETGSLLHTAPAAYRTQINDLLVTALAQTLSEWSDADALLIDLEGHGREEIVEGVDLSRTVGWFTTHFPVRLPLDGLFDLRQAITGIKELLRGIPNRGIGFGLLRYLASDGPRVRELRSRHHPEISFNYLGQFDQQGDRDARFTIVREPAGASRSPMGIRSVILGIDAIINDGALRVGWSYSENIHDRETIERLTESFTGKLRALIEHCHSSGAGGYTPSDFPLGKFDQKTLDKILSGVGKA